LKYLQAWKSFFLLHKKSGRDFIEILLLLILFNGIIKIKKYRKRLKDGKDKRKGL
jgi:hypothetical protein